MTPSIAMDPPPRPSSALFDVFLRLRPSPPGPARFLNVDDGATHITIQPPSHDHRRRAVERFAFTRVFAANAQQDDVFHGIGLPALLAGVVGGRDGLLATLGVTGSGKSHTVLGTRSQRGLVQMALSVLFRACDARLVPIVAGAATFTALAQADPTDALLATADAWLDRLSQAQAPGPLDRPASRAMTPTADSSRISAAGPTRAPLPRPSALPQTPALADVELATDPTTEYAITVSMYEVYNDRIFDLLATPPARAKPGPIKRRALLFKSTEQSPDRKRVAGLTKLICASFEEAMMVLEAGLLERKVAGTGSNAASSRSHGFFCIDVMQRPHGRTGPWSTSTLTIVDLAGSERARNAKTAGETLAEAGKINESLMYLGQCMQMQSDNQAGGGGSKNIVPFRQCKLTELLFSNAFPSTAARQTHHHPPPQKSIMLVTADPQGDYNATSQILRYSALAREVTVPRVPSNSSTSQALAPAKRPGTATSSGRTTPSATSDDLEAAHAEIARLTAQLDVYTLQLLEETRRRRAVEASWAATEEHMAELEQQIRDECYHDMEAAVDQERRRWQSALEREHDSQQAHLDSKIDVVIRATRAQLQSRPTPLHPDDDDDDGNNHNHHRLHAALVDYQHRVDSLERENEVLAAKLEAQEREAQNRSASPVKKMRVLKAKKWEDPGLAMGSLSLEDD